MSLTFLVLSLGVAELLSSLILAISTFPRILNFIIFAAILGITYYFGSKVFQKVILEERQNPNINNYSRKKFLVISLILGIFVVIIQNLFQGNKAAYQASLLMNYTANIFILFAAISYARAKGRNEYWGILGILGLGIIFFLKSKPKSEIKPINSSSSKISSIIIIILLTIAISWTGVYMAHMNLKDEFTQSLEVNRLFFASILVIFVITIWSLIKNNRFILTVSFYLTLAITLISLFFYRGPHDVSNYYLGVRNWFFLLLILYPFFHVSLHGFIRLFKHERRIITPEGLVNYQAIILLTNFLWGIYDWIHRLI